MEHKQRAKMPASQRAKQFMPFAAVKGLKEAIAREEKELKKGERPEFGEEQVATVNARLCKLKKGTKIYVKFYSYGQCLETKGQVDGGDQTVRELTVNGIHIDFDDISDLPE